MFGRSFIAEPGEESFGHHFGGTDWSIETPPGAVPNPVKLLGLDCRDPRLEVLPPLPGELPLCSRVDGADLERQSYEISWQPIRKVRFLGAPWSAPPDLHDMLPPLTAKPLRLRSLREAEYPTRSPIESVQDSLLGGEGFIRVGGEPIWLQGPEEVECGCGKQTVHVVTIGYERYDTASGLIPGGQPLFLGEYALYFFFCADCHRMLVLSQST
jgi:hypothetical protein